MDGIDGFVFAGPRKISRMLLAPQEERDLTFTVIALVLGASSLPRLRVFEQERELEERMVEGIIQSVPIVTEWDVNADNAVQVVSSPQQEKLEMELRAARGEGFASLEQSFVLPR